MSLAHIAILVCILSLTYLSGCTRIGIAILNGAARSRPKFSVAQDISYGSKNRQKLDVYRPQSQTKMKETLAPVVVFFYGGSWRNGSKNLYPFMGEALCSRSFVAVIPDYRVYPEVRFPTFVEDGAKALVWVREHIQEYGGDPHQIYLMGHSAGAHIAALLTFDEHYFQAEDGKRKTIKGFVGLAGPYDFLPFDDPLNEKIFAPKENFALSQPIHFVDGSEPPALLLHGEADRTVRIDNTINLAAQIKKAGGRVTTQFYKGMTHLGLIRSFSKIFRKKSCPLDDVAHFIQEPLCKN